MSTSEDGTVHANNSGMRHSLVSFGSMAIPNGPLTEEEPAEDFKNGSLSVPCLQLRKEI